MSPIQFVAKAICTIEGHVIGEISKPSKPGQTESFGEVWYRVFYNKLLPDILTTNKCFVCEKDYRLWYRESKARKSNNKPS